MDANILKNLTIKEVLTIKNVLGLSDAEAIAIFFGGVRCENV